MAGKVPARGPLLPLLPLLRLLLLLLLDAVVVDVDLKLPVLGVENRERDRRRADPAPDLLLAAAWDPSDKPPPERPLLSSRA